MMPPELVWLVPLLPLAGAIVNGLFLSGLPPAAKREWCGKIAVAASSLAFVVACGIALSLNGILAAKGSGKPFFDVPLQGDQGPLNWIDLTSAGSALVVPYALR